jgi:hypothetical protein
MTPEELIKALAKRINVTMDSAECPTTPWVEPLLRTVLLPVLEAGDRYHEMSMALSGEADIDRNWNAAWLAAREELGVRK